MNDKLRADTEKVIKFCIDNDIAVFFGTVDENVATEVSWSGSSNSEVEKYLATIKKTETQILIIDIRVNEIDENDGEINQYQESLVDENLKKEFEDALKIVKKTKGHLFEFTMCFFHNNVCYSYHDSSEWIDDYEIVLSSTGNTNDDDELPNSNPQRLNEDKIEELARELISNEKYITAKTPTQRSEIADGLLKPEDLGEHSFNKYSITRRAERLYETEIRPKLDEEIKKKILELKSKNIKKVEIASKLNISLGMVNKFYYAEN